MNLTDYLQRNKKSRQIVFTGQPLTARALWVLRDDYVEPLRRLPGA